MSTAALDTAPAAVVRRRARFYLIMSLVLTAIVLFGFAHTVPGDFLPPGLPGLLQLHAAVFVAWVLLFVAQPSLAMRGSVALHRRLGWVGAALAVAMVTMGGAAVLFALRAHTLPDFYAPGLFITRAIFGLAAFAGLVIAGVVLRRRAHWHKRLLLCASIVIIGPGLERALPFPLLGPHWNIAADLVTLALVAAGFWHDLATRGRVHAAYWWSGGAILAAQLATDLLAPSPLADWMVRQVGAA